MVSTQTTQTGTSQTKPTSSGQETGYINISTTERWISIVGGSALTLFGIGRDISRRSISPLDITFSLLGGVLIFRGATGHDYIYQALDFSTAGNEPGTTRNRFEKVMTINCSDEHLYRFWKDFDTMQQPSTSNQAADQANTGQENFTLERERELQAWQTLKATVSAYSGTITFDHAPAGRGTEVRVVIEYTPRPLGKLGSGISMLTRHSPEQQVTEDLRHFKEMMEAGEIPTTEGQPSGRS